MKRMNGWSAPSRRTRPSSNIEVRHIQITGSSPAIRAADLASELCQIENERNANTKLLVEQVVCTYANGPVDNYTVICRRYLSE